jgi:hypothetical protein
MGRVSSAANAAIGIAWPPSNSLSGKSTGCWATPERVLLAVEHRASSDSARVLAEYDTFIVVAAEAMRS